MKKLPFSEALRPHFGLNNQLTKMVGEDCYTANLSLDYMAAGDKVDKLISNLQTPKPSRPTRKQCKAIQTVLINALYCCEHQHQIKHLSLTLFTAANSAYKHNRYNQSGLGVRVIKAAVDILTDNGFITHYEGFRSVGHKRGIASRFSPTEKLMSWYRENQSDLYATPTSVTRELIHRKVNKVLTDYDDTPLTHQYREELKAVNSSNAEFEFSYEQHVVINGVLQPTGQRTPIDSIALEYSRYFNGGWTEGGRFYNRLSSLSKAERRTLQIDGESTTELDYGNLQLRIMYAEAGLKPPAYDLYSLSPKYSREDFKLTSLLVANCVTRHSAQRTLINKGYDSSTANDLIQLFEQAHSEISEHFYSEFWKTGMFVESCIGIQVMKAFADADKPIVNIHDGFRVRASDEDYLRACMTRFYSAELGHSPTIDYD